MYTEMMIRCFFSRQNCICECCYSLTLFVFPVKACEIQVHYFPAAIVSGTGSKENLSTNSNIFHIVEKLIKPFIYVIEYCKNNLENCSPGKIYSDQAY